MTRFKPLASRQPNLSPPLPLTIMSHAGAVHWLQLLSGLNLAAKVLSPSLAIAAMARFKVTNPPAAAAATIFATSALAQRQPLWGALFLLSPALVGCAWAFVVQFALAKGVDVLSAHERRISKVAAVEPSVRVSVVDPAVALCITQAIEGAAFVDDPLSFMIDALSSDRARLQRQKSVLKALGVRTPNPWADPKATLEQRRLAALRHIQREVRLTLPKMRARRTEGGRQHRVGLRAHGGARPYTKLAGADELWA